MCRNARGALFVTETDSDPEPEPESEPESESESESVLTLSTPQKSRSSTSWTSPQALLSPASTKKLKMSSRGEDYDRKYKHGGPAITSPCLTLLILVVYKISSRHQAKKTILPGLHWFFANDVKPVPSVDGRVFSVYEFLYRADTMTSNGGSKVKPALQVISPTKLKITIPSLKGAMSTQASYDALKTKFDAKLPEGLAIAHTTMFSAYNAQGSNLNEFTILIELNNGDTLDNQILSPGLANGKVKPVMILQKTPYEAFTKTFYLSEVYCAFRIAVVEETQRYSSADVMEDAFAALSLENEDQGMSTN